MQTRAWRARFGWLRLVVAMLAPAAAAGGGEAIHIPATDVRAAFAKGGPLDERADYKVHASRRDDAGRAEVHQQDTDIIYVLQGSAGFVTGGTVEGPESIGPGEIRGDSIRGGIRRQLGEGDVVIVPRGTPHWFAAVDGPFLYYVVKVPATAAGAR